MYGVAWDKRSCVEMEEKRIEVREVFDVTSAHGKRRSRP